jgi:DNA end-binding protein Ku
VAIRPAGNVLMMETMIFHDEVVPSDDIEDLPEAKELKASDRELKMAQQLIDSLSSDFEPARYRDEYREKVLDLIERKASGEEIVVQPEAAEPARVPDLMAALEASLAAVKDRDGDADGNGKAKSSSSKSSAKKAGSGGSKSRSKAKA